LEQKNDNYVISGGEDRYIKFWDSSNGNVVNEFVCQGPISSLHCKEMNQQLVLVAGDKIGNIYLTHLEKPNSYTNLGISKGKERQEDNSYTTQMIKEKSEEEEDLGFSFFDDE